jgi:hypothetical protein
MSCSQIHERELAVRVAVDPNEEIQYIPAFGAAEAKPLARIRVDGERRAIVSLVDRARAPELVAVGLEIRPEIVGKGLGRDRRLHGLQEPTEAVGGVILGGHHSEPSVSCRAEPGFRTTTYSSSAIW